MDFYYKLKQKFRSGDTLTRIIFVNALVFVVIKLFQIFLTLFDLPAGFILNYMSIPANLQDLLYHPWTIISYMFVHDGLFHILFNMVALYWFGRIFLMYFTEKQAFALYLLGGVGGGFMFILAYNVFPFFASQVSYSILMGASASIMAIIVAAAMKAPNMQLSMMIIGNIKLKYIALFVVLTSFFGITSSNAGGEIAHLGGALLGYIFIVSLRNGNDITSWLNNLLDILSDTFRHKKNKASSFSNKKKMSDAEFNIDKANRMKDIDKILDKIKTSGYQSLSADEKRRLFEQGKK
jgi:membrane associated rhomboid family serine protease